ncbi:phosphodiester glycosidase family protein [Olivibacter sitiensis]|uniref:phosphodiester glycosidase family protein n=1 Tax=Olivibacter sitiensis TaxID=376470 RepID=UPI00040633B5|nr:phosphodiester glycosidase family protein [Olivibacter sitiensis]
MHTFYKLKHRLLTLAVSIAIINCANNIAHAQNANDSLLIATTAWKSKPIKEGVVWKQAHYTQLFDSEQEINLVEVDLKDKKLGLALEGFSDSLALTSAIAQAADATVAINGGFFDMTNGGGTTLLKKDGQLVNSTTLLSKNGERTARSNGALMLKGRKTSIIWQNDLDNLTWDLKLKGKNIMVCGPMLLSQTQINPLTQDAFNDNRHPRSAVAITKDQKLLLITIDGRNAKAQGMNLHELAYFLYIYGAKEALNLDGGGSTALYIKGEGVVNYPSDNKLFDHLGERKVANCILVY